MIQVDQALLEGSLDTFTTSVHPSSNGPTFSRDFGSRKMEKELAILDMPARGLPAAWNQSVQSALSVKLAIEEEVEKSKNANVSLAVRSHIHQAHQGSLQNEHVNRTFDYEPFFRSFITSLHSENFLDEIISPPKTQAKKTKR